MNKKIIISLIVVVAILAAVCFALRTSVNNKIETIVKEMQNSGFEVEYNKKSSLFNLAGDGKIKIIDPITSLDYVANLQEDEEQRENLKKVLSTLDVYMLSDIFEGMVYDYDFTYTIFNSGLDFNLYLTRFSNSLMSELEVLNHDKGFQSFLDILENRGIHINIDENSNYVLKDIDLPTKEFHFILKGVNGSKNISNIALYDFTTEDNGVNLKIENFKLFYEESSSKKEIDSKLSVENISFFADRANFSLNNFGIDSFSKIIGNDLESKTDIKFSDFSLTRVNYYDEEELKTELNDVNLNINLNKFPYEEYKDFLNAYVTINIDLPNFFEKGQILLDAISQAKSNVNMKFNSKDLLLENLNIFQELGIDGEIIVSDTLGQLSLNRVENLFEKLSFEIKVDKESVQNAISDGRFNRHDRINMIESEDKKYNLFKIELKEDGIFVNDSFRIK